jgi:hypothetical protein
MISQQLSLFEDETICIERKVEKGVPVEMPPLDTFDHVLISLSGGKDSIACLFYVLDQGVDISKIEIAHQSVDGGPEDEEFMDWPVSESYCQAVGDLFNIPVSFQWRSGGILGEMMRKESLTGDCYYVHDGNIIHLPTQSGKPSTRLKWPAMSADLRTRWCSAYAKIDVFRRVLNNHPKYQGTKEQPKRIAVITGERRQESPNRAKYNKTEMHQSSSQSRIVYHHRPVIDYSERDIWDMYEKRRFLPHPAYLLGWNRTSCFACIFQSADLWACMREIAPERFYKLVEKEQELQHTIDPKLTLEAKANMGSIDRLPKDARLSKWVNLALNRSFNKEDLIMDKFGLPAGAFRIGGGPN